MRRTAWQTGSFRTGQPASSIHRKSPASLGLTDAQAAAVRTLQQGLKRKDGRVVTAPFSNGDISASAPTFPLLFGAGQMRNVVLNDAAWKPETFDLETMMPADHISDGPALSVQRIAR